MPYVALAVIIGGFVAGAGAVRRFVPPLAESVEGRLAFTVVAVLAGAAGGAVVAEIWTTVNTLSDLPVSSSQITGEVVATGAEHVLLYGGVLVALASVVYLLGPAHDQPSS